MARRAAKKAERDAKVRLLLTEALQVLKESDPLNPEGEG